MPQFPPDAIREAVVNAIVHADYTMKGASVQIAIFSNRIELTNPGSLVFGQTMETALSDVSRLRNRLIGRILRETSIIEQLGTGLQRIIHAYSDTMSEQPIIEELNNHFRITLFEIPIPAQPTKDWERQLLVAISKREMSTQEIAKLWKISERTARNRVKKMVSNKMIKRHAKSKTDPNATYTAL